MMLGIYSAKLRWHILVGFLACFRGLSKCGEKGPQISVSNLELCYYVTEVASLADVLSRLSVLILQAARRRCLLALGTLNPRSSVSMGRLTSLKLKFTPSAAIEMLLSDASRHPLIGCSYSSAFWQHSLGFNFRHFDVSNMFFTVTSTCAGLGCTDVSIGNLRSGERCWMFAGPG